MHFHARPGAAAGSDERPGLVAWPGQWWLSADSATRTTSSRRQKWSSAHHFKSASAATIRIAACGRHRDVAPAGGVCRRGFIRGVDTRRITDPRENMTKDLNRSWWICASGDWPTRRYWNAMARRCRTPARLSDLVRRGSAERRSGPPDACTTVGAPSRFPLMNSSRSP